MNFDWDATKARANVRKHGVSFDEARSVFDSALAITVDDPEHSEFETREKTIGASKRFRVLVVSHTKHARGVIWIVSARRASRAERTAYEEEIRRRLQAP
jgi:uncharacterized DUF497 family protein